MTFINDKPIPIFLAIFKSIMLWVVAAFFFALLRLYGVEEAIAFDINAPLIWKNILFQVVTLGIAYGLPFGVLDILMKMSVIERQPYWLIILFKSLAQVLLGLFSFWLMLKINMSSVDITSIENEFDTIHEGSVLNSKTLWIWIGYSAFLSLLVYFFDSIKNKIGGRILLNLILGKYHSPRQEERVFMFLDMKSSTTYAEKLGHMLFSKLIQDCFNDITHTIIRHEVEIYQYIGDEVVLTWKVTDGLRNANCLRVYFTFMNTLKSKGLYYQQKYGFVPYFKAGVHLGSVTVAEVGVIKREIAYHSDVLNTASRIQSKCNDFSASLLISESLASMIEPADGFLFKNIGNISLRGKEQQVGIYEVLEKA